MPVEQDFGEDYLRLAVSDDGIGLLDDRESGRGAAGACQGVFVRSPQNLADGVVRITSIPLHPSTRYRGVAAICLAASLPRAARGSA